MIAAIIAPGRDTSEIAAHLKKAHADFQFEVWPDILRPEEIDSAIVWNAADQVLAPFKNLRHACSLGAGVNHLIDNSSISTEAIISRVVDPTLTQGMIRFAIMAVTAIEKRLIQHVHHQRLRKWEPVMPSENETVGILGLGAIGYHVASSLSQIGYRVAGYSRTPRQIPGVSTYSGEEQLTSFLEASTIIINVLPLTSETRGFLGKKLFDGCSPGTYIVNIGRGEHLVEADLIRALNSGQVAAAILDVFEHEPLPDDHPFWADPRILITPHIASITPPSAAAELLYENTTRLRSGSSLLNTIDRSRGY